MRTDFADYPLPAGRPNATPTRARRALTRKPIVRLHAGRARSWHAARGWRAAWRFGAVHVNTFRRLAGLPLLPLAEE